MPAYDDMIAREHRRPTVAGKSLWDHQVDEQEQWIAAHGGDLAGYIARYATRGPYSEAQAVAIYEADCDELKRLRSRAG